MKKQFLMVVVAFFSTFLLPLVTNAAVFRIPSDQPTIRAGINAAVDGDTVLVLPGTYFENISFLGKSITLVCEEGAGAAIIDGGRAGPVVTFSAGETSFALLKGFTIKNGLGGIICLDSSPSIVYCKVLNNSALCGGGIYFFIDSRQYPNIIGCEIDGNQAWYGGGVYLQGDVYPYLLNCMITDNKALVKKSGGGILVVGSGGIQMDFCTIAGNSNGGISLVSGGGIIYNSILWNNRGGEIITSKPTVKVYYSVVKGGWPSGANNRHDDPLFIGGGDYHIRSSSPCIDAGIDIQVYSDIDGQPRDWGAVDIGADEYR